MLSLEYLKSQLDQVFLSHCHAHTASRCPCLSFYINDLPIKLPLLLKREQFDVFEVIDEVASDLEDLAVNYLDLSMFLALSQHIQVDAEGRLYFREFGVYQVMLVSPHLLLLKSQ